jgi:hypothetical protein
MRKLIPVVMNYSDTVFIRAFQANRTSRICVCVYGEREIYCEELAHVIMEVEET